jgi:caffeoyl-CoA O-methyltransferase
MSPSAHGRASRTDDTENWGERTFAPEPRVLARARALAEERGIPPIALGPAEGKLLQLLLTLHDAKRVVEVGTLFGYSAAWIARALPEDGHLWTCELHDEHASTAEEVFAMAGIAERVTVLRGDAAASLESLAAQAPFDAIFIDADKAGYPTYLDWAERHLRSGGLVVGDNTYLFGHVHEDASDVDDELRPGLEGMQAFNRRLADPERYLGVLVPTGEGMTVAIKR